MNIGFVGCGVMGHSMIKHLMDAGHNLKVYSRTKKKCEDLLMLGAKWAENPAEASSEVDIVMTMVGLPSDVEDVYFGSDSILSAVSKGTVLIDFTTSAPSLSEKIYDAALEIGCTSLDAPVSGGDIGARNATLSIMVGGDKEAFDKLAPIWGVLGKNSVYQGKSGSGQRTKICNQLLICTNMIGVCEAIIFGAKAGLDLDKVLESVSTGAAGSWSLSNLGTRILKNDFEPGFFVEHFVKDLNLALEEASRLSLDLPGLKLAQSFYVKVMEMGYEKKGTQALYLYLKSLSDS